METSLPACRECGPSSATRLRSSEEAKERSPHCRHSETPGRPGDRFQPLEAEDSVIGRQKGKCHGTGGPEGKYIA